ncbi:MAG: amidohydrolase/deacetylase family metallohydrolase [Chloroflexota bacterium]
MYDLLIKGGRLIDPAQNLDGKMDIGINKDKITALAKDIPAGQSAKVIDASGSIVTPGLIDFHCHVYDGVIRNGAEIDTAGVRQGVTTLLDAGSAGEANFPAFPKYLIPRACTSVFCFLHISSLGQSLQPEPYDMREIDPELTSKMISAYPDLIKGVKLRLVGGLIARNGLEIFKTAKRVAKDLKLPVMIHIGDPLNLAPPALTREVLTLMEKGDILTHVFSAKQGSVFTDGVFVPEFKEAMARGVIFDVAHGRNNCSFEVARRGMSQGIMPTTISSDVTCASLTGPTYGLTATMSKFLALGLDLRQVITMTTINPARLLGIADKVGSLRPGMTADVSILNLETGKWKLIDAEKQVLEATRLFVPKLTIKTGKVVLPRLVALPERVK